MSEQRRPATEMRVTANTMTIDPGTYCAFVEPGAPIADPATGLPAVRLSLAPGPGSGQMVIAGFGEAGWLAGRDDAALVRVVGGPAQLLVTTYQAAHVAGSPKIQMLRVSDAPVAPPIAAAGPIEAMAHIYGRGDVGGPLGEWIGERGSKRWIEGFALQPHAPEALGRLEYQAVLGRGWLSPWVEAGQFCGSRGMSLPILGLHVRPIATNVASPGFAPTFTVAVAATFVDGTAIGPVRDRPAEAPSLAALEAFQITLEPQGSPSGT